MRCDNESVFGGGKQIGHMTAFLILLTGGFLSKVSAESTEQRRESRQEAGFSSLFGLGAADLDDSIVTDRPDFTESTDAVPRGHLQLEAGYTYTYDREGDRRTRDHGAPELLVRIGLVDRLELRLGWSGYAWTEERYETEDDDGDRVIVEDWSQGANDISVGFKYKFVEQKGWVPNFGVIVELTAQSGSVGFGSGDTDPAVKLLWAYDLSERMALAGNINFLWPTEGDGRFFQSAASLSLAVALSERWGTYVEYFGFYPNSEDADCAHSVNGGLTYLVSDNFQIDGRVGAGLNEEADDFFAGVGFAWRW